MHSMHSPFLSSRFQFLHKGSNSWIPVTSLLQLKISGMYNLNYLFFFKWIVPVAVIAPALHPLHRHCLLNFSVQLGNRINSSFHKSHLHCQTSKWERKALPRWKTSVPLTCRSSLKKDLEDWSHRIHTVSTIHQPLLTDTTKQRAKSLEMSLNLLWHHSKTQV